MSIPATEVEARWNAAAEPFTAVVREVRDWGAATPCEGWDALDLLDHVIAGQRDFAARQGREVPLFDGSRQQMATQWAKHAAALSALAGDEEFIMRPMKTALGEMTVGEALIRFHAFDLIVHRWDLARSQGVDARFTDAEIDCVEESLELFGDAAYTPGILGESVPVADDADPQTRLLGRLGRRG